MHTTLQSPVKGIIALAVFILASFGAGFVGGIFSQQFAYPPEENSQLPISIQQPGIKNAEKTLDDLYRSMTPLTVSIVKKTKADWIGQSDIRSYGVILTSDGWIATVVSPEDRVKDLGILRSDGIVMPIIKQISDPALPLSFMRIDAFGMQSADFVGDPGQYEALDAIAFMPPDSLENVALARRQYPHALQDQDMIRSSDTLGKVYRIQNAPHLGVPFFSKQGQLIGISGPSGLIPAEYIQDSLKKLLKRGSIERMKLRIPYIDLAYVVGSDLSRRNGARVTSNTPITLLTTKGTVRLIDGDIITKVNDEDINENQSLSEILSDYILDDEIQLSVQGASGKTVLITLHNK